MALTPALVSLVISNSPAFSAISDLTIARPSPVPSSSRSRADVPRIAFGAHADQFLESNARLENIADIVHFVSVTVVTDHETVFTVEKRETVSKIFRRLDETRVLSRQFVERGLQLLIALVQLLNLRLQLHDFISFVAHSAAIRTRCK